MKRDVLINAGIDVENAMNRFMDNMNFYERMLNKFIEDKSFNEAYELYEKKEYDKLFAPLHTLKGVSGNLDLKALYDATCILVEELRNNEYSNVETLFSDIIIKYNKTINAINEAKE